MEDAQIVELYLQRDETAITCTSEKYGNRLRGLSMGMVRDPGTAQECENDTYWEAWRSIPPHEPRDYLYAYLARITRHLALSCCRSRNRLKRSAVLCTLSTELEQCIPAPSDAACRLEDTQLRETIDRFLATLKEEPRYMFLRRYWYLDDIAQIAAALHCTQSKVKTTLFRCRKQLRQFLLKEGYDL